MRPTDNLEPVVWGEIQVVSPLAPPHSGGRVALGRGAAEDHILAEAGRGGDRQQGELVLKVWNCQMWGLRSSYSQISDIPLRKFDHIIVSDVFLCVSCPTSEWLEDK